MLFYKIRGPCSSSCTQRLIVCVNRSLTRTVILLSLCTPFLSFLPLLRPSCFLFVFVAGLILGCVPVQARVRNLLRRTSSVNQYTQTFKRAISRTRYCTHLYITANTRVILSEKHSSALLTPHTQTQTQKVNEERIKERPKI